MKVQDKTIIVTGSGNGLGRELVLELTKKGANIIAIDINSKALQETAQLVNDSKKMISTIELDITNREAVNDTAKQIVNKFGAIDGLINNAGIIQPFIKINDLDYSTINRVIDVNFGGCLFMTKAFLPQLLKRSDAYIVNISSMGGFLPVPGQAIYGAAKAAVKLMTEALYVELSGTNVGVSVVFPGAVNTNIKRNSGLKGDNNTDNDNVTKILSPNKAAQLIIKGIEKKKYRILLGKDAKVMDFLYRLRPKLAVKLITCKMQDHLN